MTRILSTFTLAFSILFSLLFPCPSPAQDFFFSHQIIGKLKLTQLSGTGAGTNQVVTWDGSKAVWATPPGAGGGEANTASNVGAGVGVFKSKVGVDLGFKTFLAADSKITITGGTDDITFAVVPANFTLSAIGGSLNIAQINATGTPGAGNVLVGNGTWASVGLTSMVTGTLPVANGGTGQTSTSAAINALLPSKSSNSLKVLRVNAGETDVEWATVSGGSGDVTQAGTNTMTGYTNFSGGSLRAPETTVASLPAAASNTGKLYIITDGASAGSCSSGSGSTVTICRSNGSAWVAVGDGNVSGAAQYQAAGSNVGSPRGTLDFLAGTGINWTVNDTGSKVTTQPAIDSAVVLTRATDQAGTDRYCRSTTGNDTYTCSLTPSLTAYTRGMVLTLDADTVNTGTATVDVDTLGPKSILNRAGSALADGDITANKPITIAYDGTQFIVQGDGGGGTSAFSSLTGGTNTGAAMVVGAGASFRANSADATAPNKSGTSLPGTCTVGDTYIKTDATNTAVTHVCTATNTWTQQTGTPASITAPYITAGANKGLIRGITVPFVDSGYTARNGVAATMSSSVLVLTSDSVVDTINHYMKDVASETRATVQCEIHFVNATSQNKQNFCGIALRRSAGPQVALLGFGYRQNFGIGGFAIMVLSNTDDGDTPATAPGDIPYWPPCVSPFVQVDWSDSVNITMKVSCDGVHFIDATSGTRTNLLGSTAAPTQMGVGVISAYASIKAYVYHLQYQ